MCIYVEIQIKRKTKTIEIKRNEFDKNDFFSFNMDIGQVFRSIYFLQVRFSIKIGKKPYFNAILDLLNFFC